MRTHLGRPLQKGSRREGLAIRCPARSRRLQGSRNPRFGNLCPEARQMGAAEGRAVPSDVSAPPELPEPRAAGGVPGRSCPHALAQDRVRSPRDWIYVLAAGCRQTIKAPALCAADVSKTDGSQRGPRLLLSGGEGGGSCWSGGTLP